MARILLAEDDESLRRFLAAALVKAGHEVADFGDGEQAFQSRSAHRFDLLLTDLVLPALDGLDLATRPGEVDENPALTLITGCAAVALHPSALAPRGGQ